MFQHINQRAQHYFNNKQYHKAIKLLDVPDLPIELKPNLAKCYYYNHQANIAFDIIKDLEPTTELLIDQALYLNALGHHNSALDIYNTLDRSNPKVSFNLGWHLLRQGDFSAGFKLIQRGSELRSWGNEYIYLEQNIVDATKRWNGEPCENLALILEGGLGDEMIFLRWANHIKTLCENLTIYCHHSLLRLLTNAGYFCEPIAALKSAEYDYYCPAMSIPDILKLNDPQQHVTFPYISSFVEPFICRQMDKIALGQKKIGVRWAGNQEFEHDQFRTVPKTALTHLGHYGQLFNLQLEDNDPTIPNCNAIIKDWQDTYSIFANLDILVTSCTSTAHLAGAMSIPTVVLVPLVPYFVWACESQPWYNSVKIIRQTEYNNWDSATQELHDYFKNNFAS